MGEPISTKKLGGVTYNANQFTGRELGNGQFELKAKNGGEKLIFPRQSDLRTVGYETKYYTPDGKEYTYQRYGMDGLESFDGQKLTKKDIPIYGERNAKIEGGQGNRVILDDEDSARINNKSVKGEGIADQKDYE